MSITTIIGIAGGILITVWLILSLVQMRMLLRRYEKESNLSQSRMFQSSLFFVEAMPGHIRSTNYAFHLFLVWLMSEDCFRRMPGYSDFSCRGEILGHFSKREIYQVVAMTGMGSVGLVLMLVGGLVDLLWSPR